MKQKTSFLLMVMLLASLGICQYSMAQDMKTKKGDTKMKMDMAELKSWPMASQMAAKDIMAKYGKPDEVTPTMLVWLNKGPFNCPVMGFATTPPTEDQAPRPDN